MTSRRSFLRVAATAIAGAGVGAGAMSGVDAVSDPTPAVEPNGDWRSDDDDAADLYDWKRATDDLLVVEYLPGYERAANHTLEALSWTDQYVDEHFPHDLTDEAIVSLCPSREIMYMEFGRRHPVALVGSSGGRVLMPHPEYFGPCGQHFTDLEDPRRNPFVQTLIHEFSHVYFYNKLYDATGYSRTPRWFNQGVGDYLARNYRPRYVEKVDEAVAEENWDFENRPYYWGLFLVEYLYETHDPTDVTAVVESPESTFEEAVADALGVSHATLLENAKSYLRDRFSDPVDAHPQYEHDRCAPGKEAGSRSLELDLNGDGSVSILDVQRFFSDLL